jgi:glycosyltransferase involved in cell wall biosynthesis
MPSPDVAVIVPTFQMPWHLRRVLESIACQRTSRRLEVVIADDGSTDETADVVAQFAARAPFPVRFATHPHAGFHAARCRNDGVRHSTASHLLFCDGDCLLPPDHIEQHLALWRPGSVICGYCVRFDQATSHEITLDAVRSSEFVRKATPQQHSTLRAMHAKSLFYSLINHATKPSFRSGDFSLARIDFERINGFDERYCGWGCEDDDFGRRVRSAGVRLVSALHRTRVYHLWHPPATTRPQQWKQGANVEYLQRPIRLTRCLHGLEARSGGELSVRLTGQAVHRGALARLLGIHGWQIESIAALHTDLELVCRPGNGRFTGRADCRVLAVFDDSLSPCVETKLAHIVLSPRGQIGTPTQVRLRLDDRQGLWRALLGEEQQASERAAA